MAAIKQLTSPCIVISNAEKDEFDSAFNVFTTPRAPYFWMSPLMQHIPFDFVAGYIGKLKGVEDFRRDMPLFKKMEAGKNRIKESLIEII
jgi:hypothetical protein